MSVTDRDRGFQESVIRTPWAHFHTWCLTQAFRTRSDWEGNGGGARVPDTTWRAGSCRLSAQTDEDPVQPPGHLSPPPPLPPTKGRALLPRVGAKAAARGRHWCPTTVQILVLGCPSCRPRGPGSSHRLQKQEHSRGRRRCLKRTQPHQAPLAQSCPASGRAQ